jgi:hypothetical protein
VKCDFAHGLADWRYQDLGTSMWQTAMCMYPVCMSRVSSRVIEASIHTSELVVTFSLNSEQQRRTATQRLPCMRGDIIVTAWVGKDKHLLLVVTYEGKWYGGWTVIRRLDMAVEPINVAAGPLT